MRTFVIAEAGSCHDSSFDRALRLVDAAAAAGADACKFQYWSSAQRLVERRHAYAYREIYERYQISLDWVVNLELHCRRAGVEFMCTTYLPEDVAAIAPFVKRFKVASFEALDFELLAAHAPFMSSSRRIVISCGMQDNNAPWGLMARAIYNERAPITQGVRGIDFLHCVSAYPAPIEQMNLAVLHDDDYDGCNVWAGLSDHTRHPWTGALAVAAGATIIEAHLQLEDTDPQNPDAPHSRSPEAFAEYVHNLRFAEKVMGDGIKRVQSSEAAMLPYRVTDGDAR